MADFGSSPGVTINSTSGTSAGATIGREQYLVFVGVGGPSASAPANTPVELTSRSETDAQFGPDSDVAMQYRRALAGGANKQWARGIRASTTETTESFNSTSTFTLSSGPIVGQAERITVTDTDDSEDLEVRIRWGDTLDSPDQVNTAFVNPDTGDVAVDTSGNYDVTYEYADWDSAFDALGDIMDEDEFGLAVPLTTAPSVHQSLSDVIGNDEQDVDGLRQRYKFFQGFVPAQPTGVDDDGNPIIDPNDYTQELDNDAMYVTGPLARADAGRTDPTYGYGDLGYLVGKAAGADVRNPIYGDVLNADPLAQQIDSVDRDILDDKYVIPLKDTGEIRIESSTSTYDQEVHGGFERDYFSRRVVDLVLATVHVSTRSILGTINTPDARNDLRTALDLEMGDLVGLGLLNPDGQFIDVFVIDRQTVGVDLGISPYGITKNVEVTLTVDL